MKLNSLMVLKIISIDNLVTKNLNSKGELNQNEDQLGTIEHDFHFQLHVL